MRISQSHLHRAELNAWQLLLTLSIFFHPVLLPWLNYFDNFVKSPDAVLRFIIRHCGVRLVRLIPHDSRALPAELFTKPSKLEYFSTSYDFIIFAETRILFSVTLP